MKTQLPRIDVRTQTQPDLLHPNNRGLVLEVAHDAGDRWVARLDGDGEAIIVRPHDHEPRLSVIELDKRVSGNHFGTTLLRLTREQDGREVDVAIDFLATQGTVAEYGPMLDKLADSSFAALLARGGGERAGAGEDGELEPEAWGNVATQLHQAVQLLSDAPPTRLRETWGDWGEGPLDGRALTELALHPYALVPSAPGARSVPLGGRHYRVGALRTAVLRESHDTPEVRYLHAVLAAAIRDAEEAVRRAEAAIRKLDGDVGPRLPADLLGYVSIKTFHVRHLRKRAVARRDQIAAALDRLRTAHALAHRHLPIGRWTVQPPGGVRSHDPRMQRVRDAHDRLRRGGPSHDEAPLLIQKIGRLSELYEIYALSELDRALSQLGYTRFAEVHDRDAGDYAGPPKTPSGAPFPNRFHYRHPTEREMVLHYEPRIRAAPHATARLSRVARESEFLTPDFVLSSDRFVLIMDAKSFPLTSQGERDKWLADTTLRYVHGLHANGAAPVIGLMLLHRSAYGAPTCFADAGVMPTLRTVPVHPSVDHLARVLEEVLAWAGAGAGPSVGVGPASA